MGMWAAVAACCGLLLLGTAARTASAYDPHHGAVKHAGGTPPIACPAPTAPPQPCAGAQGSYRNIPDSNASACCAACYSDGQKPCAGWILQSAEEGQRPICHLKTSARFIVPAPHGNTHCGLVRNISGPPAPPAPGPMYPIKPAPPGAKNVLFIISDDMRPSIGAYGLPEAVTPHLDQLAKEGVMFTRAHIQFSYCAPSRNSFMSGRRPDATKVWNFNNNFRDEGVGKDWIALPEHFVTNGYLVTGTGKLYHPGVPPNFDQPRSWSSTAPDGSPWPYLNQGEVNGTNRNSTACKNDHCCGAKDQHYCLRDLEPGTFLLDQTVKNIAVERLMVAIENWKVKKQPFFVGMGTHRPHLGWEFPIEYELPTPVVPEATHKLWPHEVPHLHYHECAEMASTYLDTTNFGLPFAQQDSHRSNFTNNQATVRRAYYGCISYVDGLIGELLQALKDGGAEQETAVVFTGDHGWHLGEHDMWCKMSNLELGTRVPLIFKAPWVTDTGGTTGKPSHALAELVDMYPTLSELAGLTLPTGTAGEYLGGTSLVPVLAGKVQQVKNATLSQFPRCWQNNSDHSGSKPGDENNRTVSWESMSDCHWTNRQSIDFMGYKLRTEEWSVTAWSTWDGKALRPIWGSHCGENELPDGSPDPDPGNEKIGCYELYSHTGDDGMAPAAFDDYENVNLALSDDPVHKQKLQEMLAQLHHEVERWWTPNPPDLFR